MLKVSSLVSKVLIETEILLDRYAYKISNNSDSAQNSEKLQEKARREALINTDPERLYEHLKPWFFQGDNVCNLLNYEVLTILELYPNKSVLICSTCK